MIVISNRCFSYCVDSRSGKGEQLHTICLCLNISSAFFTLEVYSFHTHQSTPSLALSRLSEFKDSFLPLFQLHTVVCVLLHSCNAPGLETCQDLGEFQLHFVLAILRISFQAVFLLPPIHEDFQLATACTTCVVATFTNQQFPRDMSQYLEIAAFPRVSYNSNLCLKQTQ